MGQNYHQSRLEIAAGDFKLKQSYLQAKENMKNINLPVWNPFRKGYLENPHQQLRRLRELNPVHKGINNRWMLFRYEDVKYMLLSPKLKTIKLYEQISSKNQFLDEPKNLNRLSKATAKWLFFIDAPEHPVVRQLVVKLWNQFNVQDFIEQVVAETIEKNALQSRIEIVEQLAVTVPIKIICKILGLPSENHRQLRHWAYNFARTLELFESLDKLLCYNDSAREFYEYMDKIVEDKQLSDDSFISKFVVNNENLENPLSREQMISVFIILFFAGIETSIYLIGQSVLHLIQNPLQTQLLRDDSSLAQQAVEELIRYSSPLQYTPRVAAETLEINGQVIKKGEMIIGCVASANRDPEMFADAEKIDFTRKVNPHLSFGHGLHHCIGAKLARDEMKALLPALVRRFSKIEFDGAEAFQWDTIITNRGLKHLHVVLN